MGHDVLRRRGRRRQDRRQPDLLRRQLTLVASWTFSNIIQAECAHFSVERGVDVDKLFTHRWKLDQAEEAYKLFDKQSTARACS